MEWVKMEGSRDGPHLEKSSGEEPESERVEDVRRGNDCQPIKPLSVFILTLHTEQLVSRCVSQLQSHYTRLHHDVVAGVQVTEFHWNTNRQFQF